MSLDSTIGSFSDSFKFLVREPLERLGNSHGMFDEWEIVLYIMALAFTMEGMFF